MLDKGTDGRDFTLQTATKTKSERRERDWSLTKLTPFVIPSAGGSGYNPAQAQADARASTHSSSTGANPAQAQADARARRNNGAAGINPAAASVQGQVDARATTSQKGLNTAEPQKERTRRSYAMTWEEYNKLSDEQRAAVDFNTLLVQAREKDLNTDYEATAGQKGAYDKALTAMFGEDGGSDTYAPETLSVLRDVDFRSEDQDLDNFLGLKNAISLKELKGFSFKSSIPEIRDPVFAERVAANTGYASPEQEAAKGIEGLRESMAKSNALLHTFKASAAMFRNDDLQFFGGTPNDAKVLAGWGDSPAEGDIDSFFQDVFSALANKQGDETATWASVHKTLTEPGEKQQLMKYLKAKAGEAENPDEFLKRLGLDDTTGGSDDS